MTDAQILLVPCPRKLERLDSPGVPSQTAETSSIDPSIGHPQAYRLSIVAGRIHLAGSDDAGLFYAKQTLAQLRRQYPETLPSVELEDWPDFPVRGLMVDISRDKIPTMRTLFELIDLLASLKINQLQFYTEHAFAYSQHRDVWKDADPLTADEVRELDAYCRARFIELVPCQNSFGHMERWLKHPRYAPMSETPDGFTFPWGARHEGGFSLNPFDSRSIALVEELYDELLPNFTSKQFNVGCDETFDLGLGKSKAVCEARGKERVYLEFLLKIHDAVKRRGLTMQFWGDIILHSPKIIPGLPKDIVALNWGYEFDHPFETETKAFAAAGVPFYVCPGTSSWLSISGRTDNAIGNLKSAAEWGLENGAGGYLNTDWGDWGHLQYLPVSYLGIVAGAAYSWCYAANKECSIAEVLDLHIFKDSAHVMGRLMYDFGNAYRCIQQRLHNSSRLFWTLAGPPDRLRLFEMVTAEEYDATQTAIDQAIAPLAHAKMDRPDAALIVDEIKNAAAMLRHACQRGRRRLHVEAMPDAVMADELKQIIHEHRRLWLARNREGGLKDSAKRLEDRLVDYQTT